jgi:tetratricopeptide (TPR) repeat protein
MTWSRRAAPLLLIALLGTSGCETAIHGLKANYAAKQGNDFYKAGNYLKAIEWYRYATFLNPDLAIGYYHAALANLALYKPGSHHAKDERYSAEAVRNLQNYLTFNPDHEDAKNYLLNIFLQAERYDDAARFFEQELKRKEDDPEAAAGLMQKLGMIYAKKGDFESSLEYYKKRAEILKDDPEALYTIGVLCWDKVYHGGVLLDLDRRTELIEMGLDYLNRANAMRENYFEAVSYINLMYREKAKVAQMLGNQEEYERLTQEAERNMRLALDLRKKAMAKH